MHETQQTALPETRWSLVLRAGDENTQIRHEALSELLARYLPAMRGYLIRIKRLSPASCDDLLQSFVTDKVLESDLFRQADSKRGRFRTFLFHALNNFVVSLYRFENAQKRGGDLVVSLAELPEHHSDDPDPSFIFELLWAKQTLGHALDRMKQECVLLKRMDIWGIFEARILKPITDGCEPISYGELVSQFQFQSPMQASNALVTAKRMFVRILRGMIAEYTEDEAAIDQELNELRKIVSTSVQEPT